MLIHDCSRGDCAAAPRVLVVPISFVSDHVETLAEIDIEARALAEELGLGRFELMPALNDSPAFIRALARLVLRAVEYARPEPPEQACLGSRELFEG